VKSDGDVFTVRKVVDAAPDVEHAREQSL